MTNRQFGTIKAAVTRYRMTRPSALGTRAGKDGATQRRAMMSAIRAAQTVNGVLYLGPDDWTVTLVLESGPQITIR